MMRRAVPAGFKFDPRAIELAREGMRTREEPAVYAERALHAQQLAADVAAIHEEIAHLPAEAASSAAQAARALSEFQAEHRLRLERAQEGVDGLVAAAQVELDEALKSLLPKLVSGSPVSPADRRRVLRLVGRVRRVQDLDAGKLLRDRLGALDVAWSDLPVDEAGRRASRARREVRRAERAAADAAGRAQVVEAAADGARVRLVERRAGRLSGQAAAELAGLLGEDLAAAEAAAQACRAAAAEADRFMVDALGALDGRSNHDESEGA